MNNQICRKQDLINNFQNNIHEITISQLTANDTLSQNQSIFIKNLSNFQYHVLNQQNFKFLIKKIKELEQQLKISKQKQIKLQQNNKQLTDMLISANQHSVKKNSEFVHKVQTLIQNLVSQPKSFHKYNMIQGDLKKTKQLNSTFNSFKTEHSKQLQKINSNNYKQNMNNCNKNQYYSPIRVKTQSSKCIFDKQKLNVNKNMYFWNQKKQKDTSQLLNFKKGKSNSHIQQHKTSEQYKTNLSKNFEVYSKMQKKMMRV